MSKTTTGRLDNPGIGSDATRRDDTNASHDDLHASEDRRVDVLLDAVTRLLTSEDPTSVIRSLAERVSAMLGLELFVNFFLTDTASGQKLQMHGAAGWTPEEREQLRWYELGSPICGMVAADGVSRVFEASKVPTTDEARCMADRSLAMNLGAWACVPLMVRGRVVGTLGFGSRTRTTVTDKDLAIIRSIVDPISLAMERVEADVALRQAHDRAEQARSEAEAARAQAEAARVQAEAALARAEAAGRAKDRFLAVLSHELRTPLTPVAATLDLLSRRSDLPPEVRSDLAVVRRNIDVEARLIDDLLDLNRVARGKVRLAFSDVGLGSVLATCVNEFAAEAADRGITLRLEARQDLPVVRVDPLRMRQVLANLLSNAIKFTPAGGRITVRARAEAPREDAPGKIEVAVTDTGIGIPHDMLPALFHPFEQGDRFGRSRPEGLGLGLAIARSLTELHGGSVRVDSAGEGSGSTFVVSLPWSITAAVVSAGSPDANPAPEPVASPEPVSSPDPDKPPRSFAPNSARRCHVLLVDDHADTLRVVARVLKQAGYDVTTAAGVRAALDADTLKPAEILVSDIGLPDGNGTELMTELRSRRPSGSLPALAISGFGMDDDTRRSLDAGFADHLTKPLDLATLEAAMRRVADMVPARG